MNSDQDFSHHLQSSRLLMGLCVKTYAGVGGEVCVSVFNHNFIVIRYPAVRTAYLLAERRYK